MIFITIKHKYWYEYDFIMEPEPKDIHSFLEKFIGKKYWSIAYKNYKFKVDENEGYYMLIKYPHYLELVE